MNYERITYMRESLELTQRQMAKELGISKSPYARWEVGKNVIPIIYLAKMCNITRYTMDFGLGISDDRKKIKDDIVIDLNKIGNKIKQIRLSKDLNQRDFAKSLNMSQSTIYKCENGKVKNLTSILYEIATTYNVSVDWFCK